MQQLLYFLSAVEEDPRITTAHISLFVALWKKWKDSGKDDPLSFFRYEVMGLCKIAGPTTYHRTLRQLDEYGYIKYQPSYNRYTGSSVEFIVNRKK